MEYQKTPKLLNTELKRNVIASLPNETVAPQDSFDWQPYTSKFWKFVLRNKVIIVVLIIILVFLIYRYRSTKLKKLGLTPPPGPQEVQKEKIKKYVQVLTELENLHQDRLAETEVAP